MYRAYYELPRYQCLGPIDPSKPAGGHQHELAPRLNKHWINIFADIFVVNRLDAETRTDLTLADRSLNFSWAVLTQVQILEMSWGGNPSQIYDVIGQHPEPRRRKRVPFKDNLREIRVIASEMENPAETLKWKMCIQKMLCAHCAQRNIKPTFIVR